MRFCKTVVPGPGVIAHFGNLAGSRSGASDGSGSGRPERYGFAKQLFWTQISTANSNFGRSGSRASDESGSGRPERYGFEKERFRHSHKTRKIVFWGAGLGDWKSEA